MKKIQKIVVFPVILLSLGLPSSVALAENTSTSDNTIETNEISFEHALNFLTEEDFVDALSWVEQNYAYATSEEQNSLMEEQLLRIYNSNLQDGLYRTRSYNGLNLTSAEKKLVASHPIEAGHYYTSSQIAKSHTLKIYGKNGYQDNSDAFRHAVWNGALTQRIGVSRAKVWTDAHEQGVTDKLDKAMDLHNNKLGRDIGSKYGKSGQATNAMVEEIHRAIKSGRGRRIQSRKLVATT